MARGEGRRSFGRATRAAEYNNQESRSSRITRAQTDQRADQIKAKAQQHFEKHKGLWTQREYTKLLRADSPALRHPAPQGVTVDRKGVLMRRAEGKVQRRQDERLDRINQGRKNIIARAKQRNAGMEL